jgi:hypothetical protein
MCVLCNDTFSRSDILKRHFQKCSVRRGNPTGASHLSNPAAHLKKSQAAAAKAAANAAASAGAPTPPTVATPVSAGLPGGPYTSTSMASNNVPTTAGGPPPTSMSYSMSTPAQAEMQRPNSTSQMQNNQDPNGNNQWAMHNARNQQMMYHQGQNPSDHFAMQNQGNEEKRVAMPNAHMDEGWGQMFPPGTNEQYMNPVFSGYDQSQQDVKHEAHEAGQNGYYIPPTSLGANPDGTHGPLLWNLSITHDTSLQSKSSRLIDFCFPGGIQVLQEQPNNRKLRDCLTPDAINHFVHPYLNFQSHFPWLHIPSLNLLDSYDGLLLVIICGGAVYSDRILPHEICALFSLVKDGIRRTAQVLRHDDGSGQRLVASDTEIDELFSLQLLYSLMTWHGGSEERQIARTDAKETMLLARRYGLEDLAGPDSPSVHSHLHNVSHGQPMDPVKWDWIIWFHQEKRIRLLYLCYLADAALTLFTSTWCRCSKPTRSRYHCPLTTLLGTCPTQKAVHRRWAIEELQHSPKPTCVAPCASRVWACSKQFTCYRIL